MNASIFGLALAVGIKDMLFSNGFASTDALLKTPPVELAAILGLDLYIARIIYAAAKNHFQMEQLQLEINDDERIYAAKKNKGAN